MSQIEPPVPIEGKNYTCVVHGTRPAVENDLGDPMCPGCREDVVRRAEAFGSTPLIIPNWPKRYHKAAAIMKACQVQEGFDAETAQRFVGLMDKILERLPPSLREYAQQQDTLTFEGKVTASGMYFHEVAGRFVDIFDEYEQDFHDNIPENADWVKVAQVYVEQRKAKGGAHLGTPEGVRFAVGECTVEVRHLVRIEVKGKPHPEGFPHCPDDGGLVGEIIDKLNSDKIYPVRCGGGSSGGGTYIGFFDPDTGKMFADWLQSLAREKQGDDGEL